MERQTKTAPCVQRVLLASPFLTANRGNTITVRRIAAGLRRLGLEVETVAYAEGNAVFSPADVTHVFHASRFARFWRREMDHLAPPAPLVVTMTGTDVNRDLFDESGRYDVFWTLERAAAVVLFSEEAREMLRTQWPGDPAKLHVVPQGLSAFPDVPPEDCARHLPPKRGFTFLLPAGIRPIKNVLFAVRGLKRLRERGMEVHLVIAGPVLDAAEGERVRRAAQEEREWVAYVGEVPHACMPALYAQADVVLNTSRAEGQPAALIEALHFGVPVLASNVAGNRTIVRQEENGLLYTDLDEDDFSAKATRLVQDDALRRRLTEAGRRDVATRFSAEAEARRLLAIYQAVRGGC